MTIEQLFHVVVYLLIPTSNHNVIYLVHNYGFVVYLLIPTSNHNFCAYCWFWATLYIFWFLHQTTTRYLIYIFQLRCISFDSYIKPQLLFLLLRLRFVVYLLIPTSNHNLILSRKAIKRLYIFWFLHQTTTYIK